MAPGVSAEDLAETFQQIRAIGGQAGGLMVEFDGTVSTLKLRGPRNADVSIYVQDRPPFRIINLELMEVEREELPEPPVFSWDDLGAQLETTVADGFSGTVLAARDGEIVLHQAFGGADGAGRPFSLDTAFDIGSIPIDFTHGAVRLLVQRGQLDLDAPITEYLSDVPGDKAQITIGHLIRSESGLSNFHGQPGDADMDLAPIGREEAIRRIMSQPLLFEPGRGNAHSHSAWTLLAALTEIVSGQSYMGFLQTNFFEPAGMTRTGLYGPDARFEEADQAIGFGYSKPATPNVPLNWGPTSWLVMGSGGMVSTPMDLYRWHRFIRGTAGPLTATTRASLSSAGMSLGTTDRGFMTMSAFDGDTIIIACTNRFESRANPAHQVVRGLGRLVAEGS
jgi:CubicO group peptidase (beta-lactamase class C family)